MKVKHYDMVVAKAANFELVQLMKINNVWEAVGSKCGETINFSSDYEYFLCLPQHTDACLHWLNGGDVEEYSDALGFSELGWHEVGFKKRWSLQHQFMSDMQIRIKPKKEKRWLMIQPISGQTTLLYSSPQIAKDSVSSNDSRWQLKEIEVELNDR